MTYLIETCCTLQILLHHYTDWERPHDPAVIRDNLMEMLGDGQYASPMMELTHYHADHAANTYLYRYPKIPQTIF